MKHIVFLLAAALALAAPAFAQSANDARWDPWIGCWAPIQAAPGARVCITRSAANAVAVTTNAGGAQSLTESIVADAMEHPVNEPGCAGTQRAEWSSDGHELFSRAQLTCGGAPRTVSGMGFITPAGQWLDVQSVSTGGHDTTRVRRYRPITDAGAPATRRGAPLTLAAVKDASHRVPSEVVEAALAETNTRFDLDSHLLVDLADSGVPPSLIDVMVALSYPRQFIVERNGPMPMPISVDYDPYLLSWAFGPTVGYPFLFDDGGYYGYASVPVRGGAAAPQPSGLGRVVNGSGYTRVRPRDESPAQLAGASDGSRSTASARSGTASPHGYSSGSSSSGSSSSGGSSGGGDSGGGRTAVPR